MIGDSWEDLGKIASNANNIFGLVFLGTKPSGEGVVLACGQVTGPINQLWKSSDFGEIWVSKGQIDVFVHQAFCFRDRGAGRVFMGLGMGGGWGATSGRVYESTNWGESWTQRHQYCKETFCIEYCGGSIMCVGNYCEGLLVAREGLARSTDDGLNWNNLGTISGSGIAIADLHYAGGNILLAGIGSPAKICRSTNKGAGGSWSDILVVATESSCDCFVEKDGVIFAGIGEHVWKSTDQGQNWTDLGAIAAAGSVISSMAYFGNGVFLGVTTNGYVIRSIDDGLTWQNLGQIHSYGTALFSPIVKVETEDTLIAFIGTEQGHLFKSTELIEPLPKLGEPTDLLCEQKKNPTDVTDPQPEFSAMHRYE